MFDFKVHHITSCLTESSQASAGLLEAEYGSEKSKVPAREQAQCSSLCHILLDERVLDLPGGKLLIQIDLDAVRPPFCALKMVNLPSFRVNQITNNNFVDQLYAMRRHVTDRASGLNTVMCKRKELTSDALRPCILHSSSQYAPGPGSCCAR